MPPNEVLFGQSASMQLLWRRIEKVASANIPVLIQGESGTGKELLAKLIHYRSPWASGPLVKVNCPSIPGTLMESELFGYEKGAFTGAYGFKPGRVEQANGGSLFLDEIGDLELDLQAKLLQVLQDGKFCRIGGQEDTRVELRLICATNRPLEEEVEKGRFRQDLFYRINVVNLKPPPLRERPEDIPILVRYFLNSYNEAYNGKAQPLSAQVLQAMQRHSWPGNIRELENLIRRYVIMGTEDAITSELVVRKLHSHVPDIPADGKISLKQVTRDVVQQVEREVIQKVLQNHNWNRKRAARALGISYRALLYKIRDAGLPSRHVLRRSGVLANTDLAEPNQGQL